jgi:signal transduction histidine kinase
MDRVIRGLLWRLRMVAWALTLVALSAVSLVLLILTVVGTALIVVWVGIPLLLATVAITRPIAQIYRRFVGDALGARVESPYVDAKGGGVFARLRAVFADPATRRDLVWVALNGTVGLALSILALIETMLELVLLWWLPGGSWFLKLDAYLARALLSPTEKTRLARRVRELTESRAVTVDAQATEIRRIERDLHDGAQARLIVLGMNLGLAENAVDSDPEAAKLMLAEARAASSEALSELRGLVRGIHPPVLADRGLVGAVQALALAAPMRVQLDADVPDRLPAPVESAAYFAVSEALTNVIKHAAAQHVWIQLEHAGGLLRMRISDDGRGGADLDTGSGLRGIERRLGAFDGRLMVTSPIGGPTVVFMELPCESSSPKTLPSSGTA